MESINRIIMTACFCGIGISVCQMIIPDEKFSKQINFILSLVFVIGITAPFRVFFDEISSDNISYSSAGYEIPSDAEKMYSEYLTETIESNIEKSVCDILNKNDIFCEKADISIDISDDYCISINSAGIASDDFERAYQILRSEMGEDFDIWDMNSYE